MRSLTLGMGKMVGTTGDVSQRNRETPVKIQTVRCKINKCWGPNYRTMAVVNQCCAVYLKFADRSLLFSLYTTHVAVR